MTTHALRSARSLPKAAATTKPEARRAGGFASLFSFFLAGAVPIDGGWAPPSATAHADDSSVGCDEVDR